jgi:hypothetical protein
VGLAFAVVVEWRRVESAVVVLIRAHDVDVGAEVCATTPKAVGLHHVYRPPNAFMLDA